MKTPTWFTITRYMIAWIFLWAFLDKTFGLYFATSPANAWIRGGSPTTGFLTHAVKGPFADIFSTMAGAAVVDWLFMLGLLGAGVGLCTKKYFRLGAYIAIAQLSLIYLAGFLPPEHNPFIDDHLVYIALLLAHLQTENRG